MPSSSSSSSPTKQLREYLQEQQKPFVLDVYLSERNIMLNKSQKWLSSYDLNTRGVLQTKKILRLFLHKFLRTSQNLLVSGCHRAQKHQPISKTAEKLQQIMHEMWWLPKASRSSSVSLGSSRYNVEDSSCYEKCPSLFAKTSQALTHSSVPPEALADKDIQWQRMKEIEQLSPVSELDEQPLINKVCRHIPPKQDREDVSTSSTGMSRNSEEDTVVSAFMWDFLIKTSIEKQNLAGFTELQEIIGPAFSQHLKNKRVLRQSMQLHFDCVKEGIEAHRRKNGRKQYAQEFIGLQELGKIICEQICSWGKQNVAEQINIDISSTSEDGYYLQQLNRTIGKEIGDAILNDIIQEVTESLFQ